MSSLLDQPELASAWKKEIESYVAEEGKLSKFEAAYLPFAPPPVFWEYTCASCIAFEREKKQCKWVTEKGIPNPGIIHPQGWCDIWMPLAEEKRFSYLQRKPHVLSEPLPIFP